MSQIQIVCLLGATGCGKTTVAEILQEQGFTRVSFATPLKEMLLALGLTEVDINGPQEHRASGHPLLLGKSPRYAMQTLGTEWRDMIDKRLWAKIALERVKTLIAHGVTKIVIDDMRFPHEIEMFREIGAVTVAVRRPSVEWSSLALSVNKLPALVQPVARLLLGVPKVHDSERLWYGMEHDLVLPNISGFKTFIRRAEMLPEQIDFLTRPRTPPFPTLWKKTSKELDCDGDNKLPEAQKA